MTATATRTKLGELLRGCTPGRVQTVGYMQVIPLLSDLQDERFASPDQARVSTSSYGTLVVNNQASNKPLLMPSGATYIVDQQAQNHSLPHAAWVKAQAVQRFNTAMCVQQGQGGTIKEGQHELMILPFPLREKAHTIRRQTEFSRLWPAIADFNRSAGLTEYGGRGHLEYFFQKYKDDLDSFVAQFEPVPNQVGAIVLVNGRVVGVERTPSSTYFRSVWRPLIRECYGSLALLESRKNQQPQIPKTRVPLRRVTSLDDLETAMAEVEREEYDRVSALVGNILDLELTRSTDDSGEFSVDALGDKPFVGQAIRDGEKVVYASLVASEKWAQRDDWLLAKPFSMQPS